MKFLNAIFLVLLVSSVLFLTGCSGSSTAQTDMTKTQTNTAGNNVANSGNSNTAGASNVFANKPAEYKVAYNIIQTAGGQSSRSIEKIAAKGNKIRIELSVENAPGSIIVYVLGSEGYVCSNENGKESCIKTANPEAGTMDINKDFESIKSQIKTTTNTRTIAGVTAYCSTINSAGINTEACASKEGVPLFLKTLNSGIGGITYEAFEYSTSVSDAELVPGEVSETINPQDFEVQDTPADFGE